MSSSHMSWNNKNKKIIAVVVSGGSVLVTFIAV